jgi:hypothetical protein
VVKVAYVSFIRSVKVEDIEGLSVSEIRDKAVDVHNEADMDDFYATDDSITSINLKEEEE